MPRLRPVPPAQIADRQALHGDASDYPVVSVGMPSPRPSGVERATIVPSAFRATALTVLPWVKQARSRGRSRRPPSAPQRPARARLRTPCRAVDNVFRHCPVVSLPGYSRPLIRVADYLAFLEQNTYDGRTRVR